MKRKRKNSKAQLLITARSGSRGGFWDGLERYVYGRVGDGPIDWKGLGVGVAGLVLLTSINSGYYSSPTLGSNRLEIVKRAAEMGDYQLAQNLFEEIQNSSEHNQVLGANTDLEELVYPEKKIEREAEEWEARNVEYPGHRDILLNLALLSRLTGETEKESEYYEQARILDPNGELIREIEEQITGN